MSSACLVDVNNLSIIYGENSVVSNVSMQLKRGEITTLIGPNGAGKTTLIKAILGLITPSRGQVIRAASLKIGYMPQKLHIDSTFPLTVERFLKTAAFSSTQDRLQALQAVGAEMLLKHSVHSLSGGETQRVMLARSLLRKPELLVLDEPAQGVDVHGQVELYNLIAQIRDQYGCAVLMISHDLHLVMAATDQVICINQHICCAGHPEKVSSDPSYIELFGVPGAENLALYSHHHNHQHDQHGDIINTHTDIAEIPGENHSSHCGGNH